MDKSKPFWWNTTKQTNNTNNSLKYFPCFEKTMLTFRITSSTIMFRAEIQNKFSFFFKLIEHGIID